MAIVRIMNGEPRIAWYWAAALWLPTAGVITAIVLVPFMLWMLAQPLGTVSAGLVIGVGVFTFQASFLAWWLALHRLLRHTQSPNLAITASK